MLTPGPLTHSPPIPRHPHGRSVFDKDMLASYGITGASAEDSTEGGDDDNKVGSWMRAWHIRCCEVGVWCGMSDDDGCVSAEDSTHENDDGDSTHGSFGPHYLLIPASRSP